MFLSKLTSSRRNQDHLVSMLTQVMNDLNTQKVCVLKGEFVNYRIGEYSREKIITIDFLSQD